MCFQAEAYFFEFLLLYHQNPQQQLFIFYTYAIHSNEKKQINLGLVTEKWNTFEAITWDNGEYPALKIWGILHLMSFKVEHGWVWALLLFVV